jgi:hypothetical protein
MNILGRGGSLELKRDLPEPLILPTTALGPGGAYLVVNHPNWWPCDFVTLIRNGSSLDAYIFRDPLDRLYFHSTQAGALNNTPASRISLASYTGTLILCSKASSAQLAALTPLLTESVPYETPLRAYPSAAATYNALASLAPWCIPGELRDWKLSTSSPTVETGALGEDHASSDKVVTSGSGSIDFILRSYTGGTSFSSVEFLRMVLMVAKGCKSEAKFIMKRPTTLQPCAGSSLTNFNGSLYYNATILFSESSLSVAADDIVNGSANFVVNGPLHLRTSTEDV